MKSLSIPITESARRFGYIIWPGSRDEEINTLIKGASKVSLVFQGADLGERNINWKYHRISIGWRWTRRLSEDISTYVLTLKDNNTLNVVCR